MRYLSKFFLLLGIFSIGVGASAVNATDSERITFDDVRLSITRGNLGLALQQMKTGANSQNLDELQTNILQGLFFNALGKPKEALESFRALGEAKSTLPPLAYVGLADSLLLIGQKDQALINTKKALLLEPPPPPPPQDPSNIEIHRKDAILEPFIGYSAMLRNF